jgi:hypothetical protein
MTKSYAVGDRVTQAQYGDGTIAAVDTYHTRIDFDACGVRTFVTDRVVLAPSTTAAPPKRAASRRRRPTAAASQAQEGTSVVGS